MEKFSYESDELTLLENSSIPFGIYQFVNKRVVTIVLSKGFMELFGFTDADDTYRLMDEDMYRDCHPDDVSRIADAAIRFATEGREYSVVYRSIINSNYHIIYAQGRHFYTDSGERLAVVWYMDEGVYNKERDDIFGQALEREVYNSNKDIKGSYDYLTGLPGMNYFFELAEAGKESIVARGEDPALLFFDFNGMKQYNLQYGFTEGDKLIKEMSDILIRHFTSENCCRFGGDRFVVYTTSIDLENRLKKIFEECRCLNEGKSLPVRVGIYLHSMGDVGAGIACDRAKMACDTNRNCFTSVFSYFSEEMLAETEKRRYIIDNLDRAINEGWIKVFYQPLVRSANGRVCDEEALARWIDPAKGFMSPADFIPILEDGRLIYKLDLHVCDMVLEKMKKIKEAGLYVVPCSINISRSDFESCDIVDEIYRRVETAGVDPSLITIEITESIVGSDVEYMKRQVERFHELGFRVWMDDYGSGYSSPDILQTIPFDTIKLDMQFLRQFDKSENSRTIINGLIKMAIGLGMETVAEGVETEEQVEFLKETGCTRLQGFYYTKPLPLDEILRRYKEGAQIGFENPKESSYYSEIGKVNLYDPSLTSADAEQFKDYFNTMPMAVVEFRDDVISIIRSNKSLRELLRNVLQLGDTLSGMMTKGYKMELGTAFLRGLKQCAEEGGQLIVDEKIRSGKKIHALLRKVSENPVKRVTAISVVVLEITDERPDLSYAYVAQALSSDYLYLYYVDLNTEHFVEYKPDSNSGDMLVERHGEDFFAQSRHDARDFLHEGERDSFIEAFTKENVMNSINNNGAFTFTYRLLIDKKPFYVNMKAVRIGNEGDHIIIGVNNVDAQMKQLEALERLKEERISFSRMSALSGDYIAFYTVNPYNDHYFEFSASSDYASLGVSKEGDNFFEDAIRDSKRALYKDDQEHFEKEFTKEKVFEKIGQGDAFILKYRLLMNGEPVPVRLKGALVNENGRQQLIIGVSESA